MRKLKIFIMLCLNCKRKIFWCDYVTGKNFYNILTLSFAFSEFSPPNIAPERGTRLNLPSKCSSKNFATSSSHAFPLSFDDAPIIIINIWDNSFYKSFLHSTHLNKKSHVRLFCVCNLPI